MHIPLPFGFNGEKRTLKDSNGVILKDVSGNALKGEEVNYYAGLRNIDSYIKANGVIGFEDKEIYVKADSLLIANQSRDCNWSITRIAI